MTYNGVEVYEKDNKVAVLVSGSFGAEWSAGYNDNRLAYDKRVVDFWLEHKDDKEYMRAMNDYNPNQTKDEAEKLFKDWGYENMYFGGFFDIELEWVEKGKMFKIREYDGSEWIEYFDPSEWIAF